MGFRLEVLGSTFCIIIINFLMTQSLFLITTPKIDYDAEIRAKNPGPKSTKIGLVVRVTVTKKTLHLFAVITHILKEGY